MYNLYYNSHLFLTQLLPQFRSNLINKDPVCPKGGFKAILKISMEKVNLQNEWFVRTNAMLVLTTMDPIQGLSKPTFQLSTKRPTTKPKDQQQKSYS